MGEVVVAAKDSPADMSSTADVRCDYQTDMKTLAAIVVKDNQKVTLLPGNFNLNGGRSACPKGGGYLPLGQNTTITGDPLNTFLRAPASMTRILIDKPGAGLHGFQVIGWGHVVVYGSAGKNVIEDVTVQQSLDRKTWLDMNTQGGCTAAFLFYANPGQTLEDVRLSRNRALMAYHHGFSMHVNGKQEGGTFKNFLVEDCLAESCGGNLRRPRDWACGFNFADTGDVINILVRRCIALNNLQDGFHCDGSWTNPPHHQTIINARYENCYAEGNGLRLTNDSEEKFCCGFYHQNGTFVNCSSKNNRHAGFGAKNELANSLVIENFVDDGSGYGAIVEYGARGARVQVTSKNAKIRAFQGQVQGGKIDLTVINPPAGKCITLGRTQRIDYLGCPNHADAVRKKYDVLAYDLRISEIVIRSPDAAVQKANVEVWGTSKVDFFKTKFIASDDQGGVPAVLPEIPVPVLPGRMLSRDGTVYLAPPGEPFQQLARIPDGLLKFFPHGTEYIPKES